jgi:hypothetical protein
MRWATRYEIHREMKAGMEQLFLTLDQYALPVTVPKSKMRPKQKRLCA